MYTKLKSIVAICWLEPGHAHEASAVRALRNNAVTSTCYKVLRRYINGRGMPRRLNACANGVYQAFFPSPYCAGVPGYTGVAGIWGPPDYGGPRPNITSDIGTGVTISLSDMRLTVVPIALAVWGSSVIWGSLALL